MNQSLSHLITAPWTTMVVFTAVRLNLFTVIGDKSLTGNEIAVKTDSDSAKLEPWLRICTAMGLLKIQGNRYRNSAFSLEHLVEGSAAYVGDLLKLQSREWIRWTDLPAIVRGGKTMPDSPEDRHRTFIRAMNNLANLGESEALAAAVDLSDCTRLVDVGGGSGSYSIRLCQKYPDLQVILLDRKETLQVTRDYVLKASLQSRISLREADIEKDSYPGDADAVLLSDVIYDVHLIQPLLQRVHKCLHSGGKLIIRGYYADPEGKDTLFGRLFVLQELVFDPAQEVLTLPVLRQRVQEGGFQIVQVRQLTERSQLLIACKI